MKTFARFALFLSLVSLCILLQGSATENKAPAKEEILKKLGGEDRYLAHVSTDKPIYRPGEQVYIRAVITHALDNKPYPENTLAQIEIISPKEDSIAKGSSPFENGSLGWKWRIDESTSGGDYKVKATFPQLGIPPAEREFNIRAFRQKRLRTQIEFARKGYGPGDQVSASLEVSRSEGGIPVGAKASVVARVDQKEAWRGTAIVEDDGFAWVNFNLPDTIIEGNGTLSFAIEDGGVIETASKTIPILLSKVDLQAYPESGELVPNIENRVYFEAIAPNGRPADVTVELMDSQNNSLLTKKTEHEGRGVFSFTPKTDEQYTLSVIEPWNIKTKNLLPKATGVVSIRALKETYSFEEPVTLEVSPRDFWKIVISKKEKPLEEITVEPIVPATPVEFFNLGDACGVLRVTAYDTEGFPRAERLIFREPREKIKFEIEPDKKSYIPGDRVSLTIKTTNQEGKPAPGFIGLTVTDDAVLEMIETREKAPRLPVMVYLEPEVKELADSHIYLSEDPDSPKYLDLLLGTQGWRRFAFIRIDDFLKQYKDDARRVLAERKPVPKWAAFRGGRGRLLMEADGIAPMPMIANGIPVPVGKGERENLAFFGVPEKGDVLLFDKKEKIDELAQLKDIEAPQREVVLRRRMQKLRKPASLASIPSYASLRIYAHTRRPDRQPNDRVDFTESVYWNAGIATDEKGEAKVEFDLSDSVTSFRILADGFNKNGAFGSDDLLIESKRPFYVEAKTPLEVTAGDKINLPVALINETDQSLKAALAISANQGVLIGDYPETITLPPFTRKRIIIPAEVEEKAGISELIVTASSGEFTDNITRSIPVKPLGFPVDVSFGGLLEKEASHKIEIPLSLTEGGLHAHASVYPSPLANLTDSLEALIRDPHGCFEQTSSTNYPLVMAMHYFETHTGVDPELKKRSREKLSKGYDRLVGFECKEKGYEWFGGDPGHEALTAYGLLEFTDMKDIHPVDQKMLERTRKWLLDRRDGNGGFERNKKALDSFGRATDEITNAYITWALALSGETEIQKELDATLENAQKSEDPYLIALTAGALLRADRPGDAEPLLKRLSGMQHKDGSVKGAKTSITRSGGQSLLVETTSLSILAWLSDVQYSGNVEKAMKWLCEACEGGRFGSTQSTVLALKAIIAYDQSRAKPKADGSVTLIVDGEKIQTLDFTKDTQGALEFEGLAPKLSPGEHEILLSMEEGSPMPYTISIEYHAEKPADIGECPLLLETEITEPKVKEGEPMEIVARVKNTKDEGLPMTLVIVGLPGGVEPRHEQLKESVKEGKFAFYEILGRDIAIYFRDMAPEEEKQVVISCIGAVPGEWTGPSSRAFLYYTPEEKKWNSGLKITVEAK